MKPTIQFNEKSRRDLSDRELRKGSPLPKTDCSFQAAAVTNGGGHCFGSRRPFRAMSQDYFKNEEPRSFAGEAALFVVIVVTAALPIISSASALFHLVRSFAAL